MVPAISNKEGVGSTLAMGQSAATSQCMLANLAKYSRAPGMYLGSVPANCAKESTWELELSDVASTS